MGKRVFTAAERWAVYTVHGEKCYLDDHPIDLQSMQIDHIIPESLIDEPERLEQVLLEFGLPITFKLNSYENWLPACGKHNNQKRAKVFKPSPLIQMRLQDAALKAEMARKIEKQTISNKQLNRALNLVLRSISQYDVDKSLYKPLVRALIEDRKEINSSGIIVNIGVFSVDLFAVRDALQSIVEWLARRKFVTDFEIFDNFLFRIKDGLAGIGWSGNGEQEADIMLTPLIKLTMEQAKRIAGLMG